MKPAQPGIFHRHSRVNTPSPKQAVSTWAAAALVVSNMIGTGVFMSLGWQVVTFSKDGSYMLSGSVFPYILLWLVGGVLALCGALCYAELATALPRSGGEYNFLSRIYHPMMGFCTGLTSSTIGFAAPIAAAALVFGDYFFHAFPELADIAPFLDAKRIAFALVTLATLAQLRSLRFTGRFQEGITGITVLLILALIFCGFNSTRTPGVSFAPHAADVNFPVAEAFGASLLYVMYAYSGWNAAAYIVGEVNNPAKALPRALIYGTLFVLVLYVAVNTVFLYTVPTLDYMAKPEVAHIAGTAIFGPIGGRIASGLICIGLIAHISGMMWVGSRVSVAIGATYPVLGVLSKSSPTQVPYVALLVQYAIILPILFTKPESIVRYVESILLFWSLMTVVGVIVLRYREPDLPRPYRTWGYPVTPLLFGSVTVFCLYQTYASHPTETLIGAASVLVGIPIYLWASRQVPEDRQRGVTQTDDLTPSTSL